ncbi:7TM diverse intracellular signaling domain-containing protein [Domibacillus sp. DTU_2020_1001157_1_SI_ALB_TIR_016]|uniref:7TM diverse intracellular signaling domain-containing protein n=1 Tax=Domibacillus sp. DTU_2020_1001157_1_SI_ALB_TIR_016 TaxID=3077789 RepID=UPI0028E5770E|nr:7TM diverse intracellular signaling domain-containing protein [Domibacillus sp. DTU_2020_1001157_1_SI_ALB_TIR_016]WNS81385.1 7TM diverse intracellular signaling domain-containing protein [Domibacillus sp. DTU_2020_1001157_1_SI_ALB_TIR_016]
MPSVRFLCGLFFLMSWFPQAVHAEGQPASEDIHLSIFYLEDSKQQFSIEEVAAAQKKHLFRPAEKSPNFGYTDSVYWFRLTVENKTGQERLLLEVPSPPLDSLILYGPDGKGAFQKTEAGDTKEFGDRLIKHRNFLFPIKLSSGEKKTYYLRVQTEGAMSVPIQLWTEDTFLPHSTKETAIHFGYYGLVIIMAVYNFFLFIFLRNKSYLVYTLFSLSYVMIHMANLGDAYQWLWPSASWWNNRSIVFFISFSFILSCFFIRHLLNVPKYSPWMDQALSLLAAIQVLIIGILFFVSYPLALHMIFVSSLLHSLFFLFLALFLWKKGSKLAKYFLFAWLFFLIGNTISSLADAGLIVRSLATHYAVLIGSPLELVLFSLGLSAQVGLIRKEKEQLYEKVQETQKDITLTIGEVMEARSKETSHHVKRVAEYSGIIALAYGLSGEEVKKLKAASPMHDLGKVGIPDSILNKPGKLTEEEFKEMKKHTTIGYNMLKHSSGETLQIAAIIAHQHHEKYDGTGYPRKLKGEDIHLFARITAIADVFDALNSKRAYKEKWDLDGILSFMEREKGKHFDPMLVDLFLADIDAALEVAHKFPE